jgi:threonyl-tRNA synthetase
MPDVHALCADMKQAMEEYKKRLRLCIETIEGVGLSIEDIEPAVRVTKEFYEQNKEFVQNIVKTLNKPALIEMWDERVFYFVLKYEFNFVDSLDKASCLSTDQIDVENGERYSIEFADADGKKKNPVILHCSPSGAIERIIYALLEKAALEMQSGKTPSLPVWLSPTQVRVIPVSEDYLKHAEEVAEKIGKEKIRVDVDDRNETLGSKIRDAEKEWIPRIIVVGEKEKASGKLQVRIRETKKQEEQTTEQLSKEITEKTRGKPYRPLPLPKHISERPKFVG